MEEKKEKKKRPIRDFKNVNLPEMFNVSADCAITAEARKLETMNTIAAEGMQQLLTSTECK